MASNTLHRDRTIDSNCQYHLVFGPKDQRKVLVPPKDSRIKERILEKQAAYGSAVSEMEGIPFHAYEW
jgi:REP element-mobilizing transposase RayT